jgi:hypothetical protein
MLALALTLAITASANDLQCLTDTVFHEARDQNEKGQYLVYRSVINRVKDKRWPNTICGVVNQYKQYSYTLDHPSVLRKKVKKEQSTYDKIKLLTKSWYVLKTKPLKGYEGVNHYLRCDIIHKVKWTSKITFLGREGSHCFYKG